MGLVGAVAAIGLRIEAAAEPASLVDYAPRRWQADILVAPQRGDDVRLPASASRQCLGVGDRLRGAGADVRPRLRRRIADQRHPAEGEGAATDGRRPAANDQRCEAIESLDDIG